MNLSFINSAKRFNKLIIESDEEIRKLERLSKENPSDEKLKRQLNSIKSRSGQTIPSASPFGGIRRNRSSQDLNKDISNVRFFKLLDARVREKSDKTPRYRRIQGLIDRSNDRWLEASLRRRSIESTPTKESLLKLKNAIRRRKMSRLKQKLIKSGISTDHPALKRVEANRERLSWNLLPRAGEETFKKRWPGWLKDIKQGRAEARAKRGF